MDYTFTVRCVTGRTSIIMLTLNITALASIRMILTTCPHLSVRITIRLIIRLLSPRIVMLHR